MGPRPVGSDVNRRRFLAAVATGSVPVAGCAGREIRIQVLPEGPVVPDGVTVETRHWSRDALDSDPLSSSRTLGPTVGCHVLVAHRSAAESRVDADAEAAAFVRETDFERSFVVVAQNMMQSARWLELRRIDRVDGGLEVRVVTREPDEPYGDDATVHTLAIRVTDQRSDVPSELAVTVDGAHTDEC